MLINFGPGNVFMDNSTAIGSVNEIIVAASGTQKETVKPPDSAVNFMPGNVFLDNSTAIGSVNRIIVTASGTDKEAAKPSDGTKQSNPSKSKPRNCWSKGQRQPPPHKN